MKIKPVENHYNSYSFYERREDSRNCIEKTSSSNYTSFSGRYKNLGKGIFKNLNELSTFVQVASVIALFTIGFFPIYFSLENDMAYRVARGTGAAITVLLPFIFLPTLRVLHAKTYQHLPSLADNSLTRGVFHNRMSFHKYLGGTFLASAMVHTTTHAYRHSVSFFSQECLTGICMLALTILPIASMYALRSSRRSLANWSFDKSYYKQFLIPHQIGWWGLVCAYGIHTRDLRLLTSMIAFTSLFCVDRVWEWAESQNVPVRRIEKIHNGMIVLEIEKPRNYIYKTGQKVYLAYPPLSAFVNNLHPFTIASNPDEEILRFVISANGDWTRYLIDHLSERDKVRVSPPFPSPLDSKEKDEARLLITSGSGIALTLAHLHDTNDMSEINIIHTTRNSEEFDLLNRYAKNKKLKVKLVDYYDTSKTSNIKLVSTDTSYHATTNRFNPCDHDFLKQFTGRVYFCGNEQLGDFVEKEVLKRKERSFFREKFNF